MLLPGNSVIQVAVQPSELPPHVAKQIGNMYLRRYKPSPAVEALRGFKSGAWVGVLVWALTPDGNVLAWALKAVPEGKTRYEVMAFVRKDWRRQGLGDALLDTCRRWVPGALLNYYPHSEESKAFYRYREEKLGRKTGI